MNLNPKRFPILLLILISQFMVLEGEDVLYRVWDYNTKLLFSDSDGLLKREGGGLEASELNFAHAITLLNLQPKTQRNVQEAVRLLHIVVGEEDGLELVLQARYFLGRIEQVHRIPANLGEASRQFRGIFEDAPEHPVGQVAGVRWMMLYAFEPVELGEKRERLGRLERYEVKLSDPLALRDYHIVMANALQYFLPDDPRVLYHLESALDLGLVRRQTRSDFLVRAAETARSLGERDRAIQHYREFVEGFVRDQRNALARQRLDELERGVAN